MRWGQASTTVYAGDGDDDETDLEDSQITIFGEMSAAPPCADVDASVTDSD